MATTWKPVRMNSRKILLLESDLEALMHLPITKGTYTPEDVESINDDLDYLLYVLYLQHLLENQAEREGEYCDAHFDGPMPAETIALSAWHEAKWKLENYLQNCQPSLPH